MRNKVYYFNNSEVENEESAKYLASAIMNQNSFNEVVQFIFAGTKGLNPEISEKTIDDAFDCRLDYEKALLYNQRLSRHIEFCNLSKDYLGKG
jgi:hypothetical protein